MSKKMEPKKTELSTAQRLKRAQGIQPPWHAMCDQEVLHYIQALANSIGCPEEHFFFPMLSITAALVSPNASIHITESWSEPAVLWFAVLAKQGEMKAPSMNILMKALAEFEKHNVTNSENMETSENTSSLVLDEVDYDQSTLRDIIAKRQNRLLMVAKDLSFLCKQAGTTDVKDRERKHVLSNVYNGNDPSFNVDMNEPMCFNVTGFFNPKQALNAMTQEDIDPVLSHLLFSCPLERDCFMEDLQPMPNYLPPLSLLFHIIQQANHSPIKYRFDKDALMMVNEYLNDLIMQKRAVPNDETRRYIFTKARAQFCRLALVCHILREAMREAVSRCEKNTETETAENMFAICNDWQSTIISVDAVQQAREIMIYFIEQKVNLLPGVAEAMPSALQEQEPNRRTPVNLPFKPHPQWPNQHNVKSMTPMPTIPAMNVLQEMQREFLNQMTSSRDLQNHMRAQQAVHTPRSGQSPAFPINPLLHHMNGFAQAKPAIASPSLVTALPSSPPSMVTATQMTPTSSAPINMVKNENNTPLALTSKPQEHPMNGGNRSSGHVRKNPHPHHAHGRAQSYNGTPVNMIKMCGRTPTVVGTEGENGTYNYDFSNLLPYASKNLRSLLTSGHKEISASIVAGRHLMPPTKTPGTENRYKTEAAVAYLQKVADIGFGTIYRTNKKSTVFRKRPFEELTQDSKEVLDKIQVTEQAYKRIKTANDISDRPRRRDKLPISMAPMSMSYDPSLMFMNSLNLASNHNNNNNISPLRLKEELRIKEEDSMLSGDLSMDVDSCSEHSTSISNAPSVASNPPHHNYNPNIANSPPSIANDVPRHPSPQFATAPLNLKRESPSMTEAQAAS